MKNTKDLILYKEFERDEIFYDVTWIIENYKNDYYNKEDIRSLWYESFHKLIELSASHGFEGNLWHNYLTYLLVNNENAYSTACEIKGKVEGSINQLALHDFGIFRDLFEFDLNQIETILVSI